MPPTRRWAHAVRRAVAEPEVSEAVATLLEESVRATGADGAVILGVAPGPTVFERGIARHLLERLAAEGGEANRALERVEEWLDEVLVLKEAPDPEIPGGRSLLAPLRVRELCTGALLLTFRHAAPPPPSRDAAAAFAGVMALLLENERLQEEARHSDQIREHFLTALNHELRTPANALLLNADLLRSGACGDLPDRMTRALDEAETNARLMIGVLRRVLDLGQLGEQAAPQQQEILQPRDAVADLLRRMEPAAKRKGLALALYVPRGLPPLQTDPERFQRILLHLLSNAIKYTATGGVNVRIERGRQHAGPHRQAPVLIVHVEDSGRGIPADQIARVFEPFAQVEEGAREDTGRRGMGLGLALARRLARSLRGDVTIASTPGQGTTATLVLPYHSS